MSTKLRRLSFLVAAALGAGILFATTLSFAAPGGGGNRMPSGGSRVATGSSVRQSRVSANTVQQNTSTNVHFNPNANANPDRNVNTNRIPDAKIDPNANPGWKPDQKIDPNASPKRKPDDKIDPNTAANRNPHDRKGDTNVDRNRDNRNAAETGRRPIYRDYDEWKYAAGVRRGIAIGTVLASLPAAYTPVLVDGTTYYYYDGAFYNMAFSEGQVVYEVVTAPAGAEVSALPPDCVPQTVNGTSYQYCDGAYYLAVGSNYRVVVF